MTTLPKDGRPFGGVVSSTPEASVPDAPEYTQAPIGAPNVVIVMLDDVGFGQSAVFGGAVETPTMARLADVGLRYTNFHTTGVCSPTRAALLTGRNHHAVGYGNVVTSAFPGYNWAWPRSAASLAEILRLNGYATAAFGKWHNTPNEELSPLGPFDRWPTEQGFEMFYGFNGGDTNHWSPTLYHGTTPVEPPDVEGYHLTEDLVDRTIEWLGAQRSVTPHKPFFAYLAPGACHSPHHVPRAFIEKYRGAFEHGWDEERRRVLERQIALGVVPDATQLTPRPDAIPAWDDCPPDHRQVYARMQEVFAGFLEHTDVHIGRIIDALGDLGVLDTTIVMYIVGDNGPSAEAGIHGSFNEFASLNGVHDDPETWIDRLDELGGPTAYNHYPAGWAWAGSSPFQWVKQVASHYGATRNPMILSWPDRLPRPGGVRSQFHHVVDVLPTILEAAGVAVPESVHGVAQQPMDGASLLYSVDADGASVRTTQYFEIWGNRAIYHDGWVAGARSGRLPWEIEPSDPSDRWELYHVADDFSQAMDLADSEPERLADLQQRFHEEAERNAVYPLDHRLYGRPPLQRLGPKRREFVYYPGTRRVPQWLAPNIKNRSFAIEALLRGSGADGVILAYGGRFGGFVLRVAGGVPLFEYNYFGKEITEVRSSEGLPEGAMRLACEFAADDAGPGPGGVVTLRVGDRPVGSGRVPRTIPYLYPIDEGMHIGADEGTPVSEGYVLPARFDGDLLQVKVVIAPGDQPDKTDLLVERNG